MGDILETLRGTPHCSMVPLRSYSSMPVATVCKTHRLERGGTHVSAQADTCTLDKICEQTVEKVHDMFLVGVESMHI